MAYDAYLYFEGGTPAVEGETADHTYAAKKAISIYSFSWGISNPTTVGHGGGMSAGKASISSLNIMKRVDTASAALCLLCASGGHLPKAYLVLRKAGGNTQLEYLKYTLEEVYVESVQFSGSSGGDDYPTESVSLAFGKITMEYSKQKPDGTGEPAKTFNWDQRTNQKQ
jgi:type VI secretion system secreted protein Hcp